jgi:hypothetical protein
VTIPPPCHSSTAETPAGPRICLTPPLPDRHYLLLARAGCTQLIRMEETFTAMTMKPARKVIWDSQFPTFFYLFNVL